MVLLLATRAHMENEGRGPHQVVDGRCADCVDELHHQLDDEDDDEQRRHLGGLRNKGERTGRRFFVGVRGALLSWLMAGEAVPSSFVVEAAGTCRVDDGTASSHHPPAGSVSLVDEWGLGLNQPKTPTVRIRRASTPSIIHFDEVATSLIFCRELCEGQFTAVARH